MEEMNIQGVVLRIERSSIHDGAGLRTVVFLKGCPMQCAWCSTPESQERVIQTFGEWKYGEIKTVDDIMQEVERDSIFYYHSGGGVTISGGEAFLQARFTSTILKCCMEHGIDTAVESSLAIPWKNVEESLPYLNHLYVDIKMMDSYKHKLFCGIGNEQILANIRMLDQKFQDGKITVRIPVIPEINDSNEELKAAAEFIDSLKMVKEVELLPYHKLGVGTYQKIHRDYKLKQVKTPSTEYMEQKKEYLKQCVKEAKII